MSKELSGNGLWPDSGAPRVSFRLKYAATSVAGLVTSVLVGVLIPDAWLIAVLLASISAGLAAIYFWRMWALYIAPDLGDESAPAPLNDDVIRTLMDRVKALSNLTDAQAFRFLALVATPNEYFVRITESVEALTRSFSISTTATIRVAGSIGEVVPVPLLMRHRGSVEDGMRFFNQSGERISSLSRLETVAYCLAVVRRSIQTWGPRALHVYLTQIEQYLARVVYYDGVLEPLYLKSVMQEITELAPSDVPKWQKDGVTKFLWALYLREPICVPALIGDPGQIRSQASPESEDEDPAGPTDDNAQQQQAGAIEARPLHRENRMIRVSARRRIISEFHFDSRPSKSRRPKLIDSVRVLFGIRPTLISVPLLNAGRAESYHLEVAGPENTYLARQSTPRRDGGNPRLPGIVRGPRRRGQRHAHLYIRAATDTQEYVYNTQYYERMPGSMGPAAASAGSLAVLVWLALVAILIGRTVLFENWEFAALVLAFPSAIGFWLGVQSERRIGEGVLAARISTLVTIALAITSAWFSVMYPSNSHRSAWLVLAALATVNTLVATASWFIRARLQSHFVGKRDDSRVDSAPEVGG